MDEYSSTRLIALLVARINGDQASFWSEHQLNKKKMCYCYMIFHSELDVTRPWLLKERKGILFRLTSSRKEWLSGEKWPTHEGGGLTWVRCAPRDPSPASPEASTLYKTSVNGPDKFLPLPTFFFSKGLGCIQPQIRVVFTCIEKVWVRKKLEKDPYDFHDLGINIQCFNFEKLSNILQYPKFHFWGGFLCEVLNLKSGGGEMREELKIEIRK